MASLRKKLLGFLFFGIVLEYIEYITEVGGNEFI